MPPFPALLATTQGRLWQARLQGKQDSHVPWANFMCRHGAKTSWGAIACSSQTELQRSGSNKNDELCCRSQRTPCCWNLLRAFIFRSESPHRSYLFPWSLIRKNKPLLSHSRIIAVSDSSGICTPALLRPLVRPLVFFVFLFN